MSYRMCVAFNLLLLLLVTFGGRAKASHEA